MIIAWGEIKREGWPKEWNTYLTIPPYGELRNGTVFNELVRGNVK